MNSNVDLHPGDTIMLVQVFNRFVYTNYWLINDSKREYVRHPDGNFQYNQPLIFMGWKTIVRYEHKTININSICNEQTLTAATFLYNGRFCWSQVFLYGEDIAKRVILIS